MAHYELRYKGDDRSVAKKFFEALYPSNTSDIKVTHFYDLTGLYSPVIYNIQVHIAYSQLDNKLDLASAKIFTPSGNKVASMKWYNTTYVGYPDAYLYDANGDKVDSMGIVESNASEFANKSPLNPTMWFKKLKNVCGFKKCGWIFEDGKIYDDGDLIYAPSDYGYDIDFDLGSKNFFRVLLFIMSGHIQGTRPLKNR